MTAADDGAAGHLLGALAEAVGGRVVGDPERRIEAVRALENAGPKDLSFLTDDRYVERAQASRAGALVVGPLGPGLGLTADLIVCPEPARAVADLVRKIHPRPVRAAGAHATAVIGDGCRIPPSAHIGAYAVIGDGTWLGEDVVIDALAAVGPGCRIGDRAVLHSHAVLYDRVEVGAGSIVHSGAVLGADGFGYTGQDQALLKMPHVGRVQLDEDVEIGANSTIDRATLEVTRIGRGTKIDNLVQVGHNAQLGEGCILCAQSGISGSTVVGDRVVFAGQTGAAGHLQIGDGVQVAAKAAVLRSVESGAVGGTPAVPLADWRRQTVAAAKLPELRRQVARLARRLEQLEDREQGAE